MPNMSQREEADPVSTPEVEANSDEEEDAASEFSDSSASEDTAALPRTSAKKKKKVGCGRQLEPTCCQCKVLKFTGRCLTRV